MIQINTEGWKWATGTIGVELEFPTPGEHASDYLSDCGLEVDYVDYNHDTYNRTVIKHDSSCGVNGDPGCELVSPPTPLAHLINDTGDAATLKEAWNMLSSEYMESPKNGARCGIHIHVGVESDRDPSSDLIRLRLDRLWRAYSARSGPIMDFCGEGRDPAKSAHARRYCGAHLALSDKYGQVNASPLMSGRQNTVEFRQLGMTRSTLEPHVEPFEPDPVPEQDALLAWYCYYPDEFARMYPDAQAATLRYATQAWNEGQAQYQQVHGQGNRIHTQLGWGDIVEWAIFVVLLTEGVCHSGGWIAKQRKLIGDTRTDGKPWSDFWDRPDIPYEEPGVEPVNQWDRLQPLLVAAPPDPALDYIPEYDSDDEPYGDPFPGSEGN